MVEIVGKCGWCDSAVRVSDVGFDTAPIATVYRDLMQAHLERCITRLEREKYARQIAEATKAAQEFFAGGKSG